MKTLVVGALLLALLVPASAFGQDAAGACEGCKALALDHAGLQRLLKAMVANKTLPLVSLRNASLQPNRSQGSGAGNWASRHPVLLGTGIGIGIGVGFGAVVYPDDDQNADITKGGFMTGLGILGAGAGALVGLCVSLLAR